MANRLRCFVFIDAMGWDIVSRFDAFSWLKEYRKPARTILGYSCTCIPSILSGKWPYEHGHWTFFYRAGLTSSLHVLKPLNHLPTKLTSHHRVRNYLSRSFSKAMNFTGYFNLYNLPFEDMDFFEYVEKKNLYETSQSDIRTIFNDLEESKVAYFCTDWRAPEGGHLDSFLSYIKKEPCDWAFFYFAGLDGWMHQHGPEGAEERLPWYEAQVERLMEELHGDVELTVFSDHGMTKIHQHVDISMHDGSRDWQRKKDYMSFYDATFARYWFSNPAARDHVRRCLEQCNGGTLLSDETLKKEHVWFPDYRFGEFIFLADPGVLFYPNHMGDHPPLAMHGYAPDDRDSWATVLSNSKEAKRCLGDHPSIRDMHSWMRWRTC